MARKINPGEDNQIFKVRGDGTIVRDDEVKSKALSTLDKELLDIIEVNSFSKNVFAARKARKIANKISKEKYGKENYKEYVEMLMVKNFPNELEKAKLGGKYLFWLWFSIVFAVVSFGFGITISAILVWTIVIPTYKNLKKI